MRRSLCCAFIIAFLGAASPAAAQSEADAVDDFPGAEFFYDAGAVGFVYAPLALFAGVELAFDPPAVPRLFSGAEGGSLEFDNTVPELYVGVGGALLASGLFLSREEGRWFHIKGMAQSVATTLAVTGIGKNVFGRRRPHYVEGSDDPDLRQSFPSGHSSVTFSMASYGCLFLHRDGQLGFARTTSCGILLATAGLVAYSRVRDHRHHASDVLAGATIGSTVSSLFFVWQERRYRDASGAFELNASPGPGLGLSWGGTF